MRRVMQRFDPVGSLQPGCIRGRYLMAAFPTRTGRPSNRCSTNCVHCGFLPLDTCPTYALWAQEADAAARPGSC